MAKKAQHRKEVTSHEARREFAELVNRAAYLGERVVITRNGKKLCALVTVADLEKLEAA